MDLTCYLYDGWQPRIRPAGARRDWMDDAPESFPYRCLPLGIANSHGWEVLSSCGFTVVWNGGTAAEDVSVTVDEGHPAHQWPVALFGQGTFTIHVEGLFRTPPGWNLHVGGPPNMFKDGAAPLTGVIETDWSPYTFTMNWRLTRPGLTVRFEENEPIAHIFPIERAAVEAFEPRFAPIDDEPALKQEFENWSRSRNAFQEQIRREPPSKPADKWQKFYYRGVTPSGQCPVSDHKTKLQPREFANPELAGNASERMAAGQRAPTPASLAELPAKGDWHKAKYEWLLDSMAQQRALSDQASGIAICDEVLSEDFLRDFYAPGRPAVITGQLESWPASRLWNEEYLTSVLGDAIVEFQGGRKDAEHFERYKDSFSRQLPFSDFMKLISKEGGNDAYLTAYNSRLNEAALQALERDVLPMPELLAENGTAKGMFWIGPAGTFTPLHHDLTNNLLVQVVGRKRVILVDALSLPRMYNDQHVFSQVEDLTDPGLDLARFARLQDVAAHDVLLEPGQMLYIPLGWWHQVHALDFSVSITHTAFRWRNDFFSSYPAV